MKYFAGSVASLLVVPLVLSGCVGMKKYRTLESKSDTLQQEVDLLRAEKAALQKKGEESKSQYEDLVGQLQQEVQEGQLKVTQYKDMLSVDVAEKIFFASGKAALKETGKKVLQKVGEVIAPMQDKYIRVVGHTDTIPVAKSLQRVFPTNWELSVARATNVVRFLQDQVGIAPERLIATGRGQYDPIALNDTPEGRQQNRRIEIMLLDKTILEGMGESRIQQVESEPLVEENLKGE